MTKNEEGPVLLTKEMAVEILDADQYASQNHGKWGLTDDEANAMRAIASGEAVVVPAGAGDKK